MLVLKHKPKCSNLLTTVMVAAPMMVVRQNGVLPLQILSSVDVEHSFPGTVSSHLWHKDAVHS